MWFKYKETIMKLMKLRPFASRDVGSHRPVRTFGLAGLSGAVDGKFNA
jgi:hypothetical protein